MVECRHTLQLFPDKRSLLSTPKSGLVLWSALTGRMQQKWPVHSEPKPQEPLDPVTALRGSPVRDTWPGHPADSLSDPDLSASKAVPPASWPQARMQARLRWPGQPRPDDEPGWSRVRSQRNDCFKQPTFGVVRYGAKANVCRNDQHLSDVFIYKAIVILFLVKGIMTSFSSLPFLLNDVTNVNFLWGAFQSLSFF